MALSIALVGGVLVASDVPYARYFWGRRRFIFCSAPPQWRWRCPSCGSPRGFERWRSRRWCRLIVGGLCGITTALGLARAFGADRALLASVAPKSATTPIAMGVAEVTGGVPAVAAMVVILTGVVGALCARPLLSRLGVREAEAPGLRLGARLPRTRHCSRLRGRQRDGGLGRAGDGSQRNAHRAAGPAGARAVGLGEAARTGPGSQEVLRPPGSRSLQLRQLGAARPAVVGGARAVPVPQPAQARVQRRR